MKPGLVDHVIAFALVALVPIAVWGYRRFVIEVRKDPSARRRGYKWTIAQQWAMVAFVLAAWFANGREAAAIGLDFPLGIPTIIGFAITAAAVVALQVQLVAVRRGGDAARESLRPQLEAAEALLPRTASEARWFRGVAITAGICEEILYRGFMIAYIGSLVGTWPAVAAGAAIFGLVHLYQGRANAVKAVIFGALLGALYVGCGTLVWPMIVHAAIDLNGGAIARFALAEPTRA